MHGDFLRKLCKILDTKKSQDIPFVAWKTTHYPASSEPKATLIEWGLFSKIQFIYSSNNQSIVKRGGGSCPTLQNVGKT